MLIKGCGTHLPEDVVLVWLEFIVRLSSFIQNLRVNLLVIHNNIMGLTLFELSDFSTLIFIITDLLIFPFPIFLYHLFNLNADYLFLIILRFLSLYILYCYLVLILIHIIWWLLLLNVFIKQKSSRRAWCKDFGTFHNDVWLAWTVHLISVYLVLVIAISEVLKILCLLLCLEGIYLQSLIIGLWLGWRDLSLRVNVEFLLLDNWFANLRSGLETFLHNILGRFAILIRIILAWVISPRAIQCNERTFTNLDFILSFYLHIYSILQNRL